MRPDDLFGGGQAPCRLGVGPFDDRRLRHRVAKLPAADVEDAAAAPDLVFFRREWKGLVRFALGLVGQRAGARIESKLVAISSVVNGLRRLEDLEPQVQCIAAEDVAHVVPADDHELEPDLFGYRLEASRAHLSRRADGEPIAGNHEGLAGVNSLAEVRHQVAERPLLPSLVQLVETLRHAIGGGSDLIGIDGVELASRMLGIPEDQRLARDETLPAFISRSWRLVCGEQFLERHSGPEAGWLDGLHVYRDYIFPGARKGTAVRWFDRGSVLSWLVRRVYLAGGDFYSGREGKRLLFSVGRFRGN